MAALSLDLTLFKAAGVQIFNKIYSVENRRGHLSLGELMYHRPTMLGRNWQHQAGETSSHTWWCCGTS